MMRRCVQLCLLEHRYVHKWARYRNADAPCSGERFHIGYYFIVVRRSKIFTISVLCMLSSSTHGAQLYTIIIFTMSISCMLSSITDCTLRLSFFFFLRQWFQRLHSFISPSVEKESINHYFLLQGNHLNSSRIAFLSVVRISIKERSRRITTK